MTEPKPTQLQPTESQPIQPQSTEPQPTEPQSTEPQPKVRFIPNLELQRLDHDPTTTPTATGEVSAPLQVAPEYAVTSTQVAEASVRLQRFAPLLQRLFPELAATQGIIESELLAIKPLPDYPTDSGQYWLKADCNLPVAGSIKARGGIYEVLEVVERIATKHQLMPQGDVLALLQPEAQEVLGRHSITVGSTGNLGLSVGIMGAALGLKAVVHMSAEAKAWKKALLRQRGATVIEHEGDYAKAVAAGRQEALADPLNHFVDDERSLSLFCGYAVAGERLKAQIDQIGLRVDAQHPLFVYIPCGVGGAPAGICYGLKLYFGDHVHCIFVEPEDSACFAAQMQHLDQPMMSIYEVGQGNQTLADGLAVPVASQLAVAHMRSRLSGIAIVAEDDLLADLYQLFAREGIKVEPSAAAATSGPRALLMTTSGRQYLTQHRLDSCLAQANHILWATGGSFVPEDEFELLLQQGQKLIQR